jgi:hypothetical protein
MDRVTEVLRSVSGIVSSMEKELVGLKNPTDTCCKAVVHRFGFEETERENKMLVFLAGDLAAGLVEPSSQSKTQKVDQLRDLTQRVLPLKQRNDWQSAIVDGLALFPVDIVDPRIFGAQEDYSESVVTSSDFWRDEIVDGAECCRATWENNCHSDADVVVASLKLDGTENPSVVDQCFFKLGYYTSAGRIVLYCPKECSERERVLGLCTKFGVSLVSSVEELVSCVRKRIFVEIVHEEWVSLHRGDQSDSGDESSDGSDESCRFCRIRGVAREALSELF